MSKIVPPDATIPSAAPAGSAGRGETAPESFREGMSRLATGVSIVTTDGPAGRAGFTATAVASVSDDPPTLLVCLQRRAQSAPRILANGVFVVSVLAASQRELADIFAGRTGLHLADRFRHGEWVETALGVPRLSGAAVAFGCRLADVRDVSTHHVLFGDVAFVDVGPDAPRLVYSGRAFHGL